VDLVVKLPESAGYDILIIVVYFMSKRMDFIPTHTTVITEGTARFFLYHIWKLHGISTYVVLDKGPHFATHCTKELYCMLEIEIASLTA